MCGQVRSHASSHTCGLCPASTISAARCDRWHRQARLVALQRTALVRRGVEVYRHVLPLREAVEHAFERELAADPRLFDAAVGMTGRLAQALIDLYPARFDGMRGAQRA